MSSFVMSHSPMTSLSSSSFSSSVDCASSLSFISGKHWVMMIPNNLALSSLSSSSFAAPRCTCQNWTGQNIVLPWTHRVKMAWCIVNSHHNEHCVCRKLLRGHRLNPQRSTETQSTVTTMQVLMLPHQSEQSAPRLHGISPSEFSHQDTNAVETEDSDTIQPMHTARSGQLLPMCVCSD